MKAKSNTKRRFAGKLDNFESKEDRLFHTYNLRAYIRGDMYFRYKRQLYPTGAIIYKTDDVANV